MYHWYFAFWNVVQICLGGIRLRDRLSRLRIGVTDLTQGGLPLLVVYGGRNKHYALIWLVEGEVEERDLVDLMLLGDQRHRWVHHRRWTRHSISRIMRCMSRHKIRRIILRSLILTSISLMRISSTNMRIIMRSLILSRSSLISRSLSNRMILSSLNNMMVGVIFRGWRGWCTRPDRKLCKGPYELTLLPHFGGHVACRIWVDADVSIF